MMFSMRRAVRAAGQSGAMRQLVKGPRVASGRRWLATTLAEEDAVEGEDGHDGQVGKANVKVHMPVRTALGHIRGGKKRNFDESVEIALGLGLDTRKMDQTLRGVVSLPHGTGKSVNVAVFATGEQADAAAAAGASIVGGDELVQEIAASGGSSIKFNRCIASPSMMPKIGRIARILGPRGLMPNPKLGTVTEDVAGAVAEAIKGQIEFRADRHGYLHASIGKVSFTDEMLLENLRTLLIEVANKKPSGAKGVYMRQASLSSTMGSGYALEMSDLDPSSPNFLRR